MFPQKLVTCTARTVEALKRVLKRKPGDTHYRDSPWPPSPARTE